LDKGYFSVAVLAVIGVVLAAIAVGPFIVRVSTEAGAVQPDNVAWIRANVLPGTPRAQAYALLRARGLVAYNLAFQKGKPIGSGAEARCDWSDPSSAAWPSAGQRAPVQEGACAGPRPDLRSPQRHPSIQVRVLGGTPSIACGTSTYVGISFDRRDRVEEIHVGRPVPVCD
jgi:hypothetical protein